MVYLSTLLLALFITIAFIPVLIKLGTRFRIVDLPDSRKVHAQPIPRIGGIAIALGAVIPIIIWQPANDFIRAYIAGAAVLFIFGFWDDLKGLDYRAKFLAQIVAALIVILYGGIKISSLGAFALEDFILPDWLAIPLTILAIVGVTNAINLSDGLDGLAGGICLISVCCIGYLAYFIENTQVILLSLSLAGAIFGFLRFNTYPATLFMGDAGSHFLGFSAVILSLAITQGNTPLSPLLPLIILGFPILDTFLVMFDRIAKGISPFTADMNHFHHKLIKLGLYHTEAVLLIYIMQGLLVVAAILFKFYSEWFLLAGYLVFSGLILVPFSTAERKGWRLRRFSLIDKLIKGRLKELRGKGFFIKFTFRSMETGIPLLIFITCFIPQTHTAFFSNLSAILLVILLATWTFRKTWLQAALTVCLYFFVPSLVYFSVVNEPASFDGTLGMLYDLSNLLLVFLVIMTLKMTVRRKGFKPTTMDFLILFIALVVPSIAGTYVDDRHLGLIVARTIMFLFCYEALMGELRRKLEKLAIATMSSLTVVIVRGWIA